MRRGCWRRRPSRPRASRCPEFDRSGLKAFAFGPIVHGDHVDGGVVIGTRDPVVRSDAGRQDAARWSTVSTTPSALLGRAAPRASARRSSCGIRSPRSSLASAAFHPVYQPIVELRPVTIVGYEALTRFAFGPTHRPASSRTPGQLGLGLALELATCSRDRWRARRLPSGRWLDLNVSPSLLSAAGGAARIAWRGRSRPIVLEITEHDAVADYPGAPRGGQIGWGRTSASPSTTPGAGIANFGHIVELRAALREARHQPRPRRRRQSRPTGAGRGDAPLRARRSDAALSPKASRPRTRPAR